MLDHVVNESDKVSIKAILAAFGVFVALCGGVFGIGAWAAHMQAQAAEQNARLTKVEMALDAIPRIERSVAKIEGYLEATTKEKK